MENLRFSRRRFITSAGVSITLPMLPSLLYSRRRRSFAAFMHQLQTWLLTALSLLS